ncbi:aminoglycoside adenylyltransferase domain-containing protein [Paenibacillus sp. GCM10027626]|uniref:aminoglycoside adenylyltransferase domain-containing protein n=1 Tax=Paenibacillus sp. GCM10027626 TaxID=3273411 RepID=UPI003638FEFC
MQKPQKWPECDPGVKRFIHSFVELLQNHLADHLVGVYLHSSLATGSYYPPKSDMDLIAVTADKLSAKTAKEIAISIARFSDTRPTTGNIEFSIVTASAAKTIPSPMPYELHYSSSWHDRILGDEVEYGGEQFDSDLFVHLLYVKKRGCCLYGEPVHVVFGDVNWDDFMFAVLDDLDWILADENIVESPYYGILNICHTLQMLADKKQVAYSKDEGGEWGLVHLSERFIPLINMALSVYRCNDPIDEENRRTGGVSWNSAELLAFRDYARELLNTY